MIVFSGLPGTGKSTLAEAIGRKLSIPVFATGWLEATLLDGELHSINPKKPLGSTGYQLLTALAERQLVLGQSAILDSVASTASIRKTRQQLAKQYAAEWVVFECVCSDENIHRSRLDGRKHNIAGWQELEWPDVERVAACFVPWQEEHLVLDAVNPFEKNLSALFNLFDLEGN